MSEYRGVRIARFRTSLPGLPGWVVLCLFLAGALSESCPLLFSQSSRKVSAAIGEVQVLKIQGTVQRVGQNLPAGQVPNLKVGAFLSAGDRIRSGLDSYVTLGLADGSWVEVQPDTELEILDFKGGIRELLRLWIGKVRIKIRKLTGAPNPYRMHTPIATIGVRGTEFEISVDGNSVTTVKVFEGAVTVKDVQAASGEILVEAGNEVTIYPLRPPSPPITLEQVVAENLNRESSVDQPVIRKFLAFTDPYLDMTENPAYASQFVKRGGRFSLYPASSSSFFQSEISPLSPIRQFADIQSLFATDSRQLEGVASRVSYAYPTGNWVWAGLFEYRGFNHDFHYNFSQELPTPFGNVSLSQVGQSFYAPDLRLDSSTARTLFVGARRFPGQALAVSYDWTRNRGHMDSLFEFRSGDQLLMSETSVGLFENDTRRISFGYHRQNDSIGSLALSYKVGLISGHSYQQRHEVDGASAPLASFRITGRSHETELEWKRRLFKNLTIAAFGSLARVGMGESTKNFRISDSVEDARLWVPSVGIGFGFNWQERIFAAVDLQASAHMQRADRNQLSDSRTVSSERTRRYDRSAHGWVQFRLPKNFFAGGGGTSFWSSENLSAQYDRDLNGKRMDSQGRLQQALVHQVSRLKVDQLGIGLGKSIGKALFLEYRVSKTIAPRFKPVSQGFLLRFSF